MLPRKSDIQAAAAAVGGHYRAVVPCAPTTCAINNKWDNGVLMVGIIEHWRQYGTAAYRTYAENWAGHNAVRVTVEADQIVIRRPGGGNENGGGSDESADSDE